MDHNESGTSGVKLPRIQVLHKLVKSVAGAHEPLITVGDLRRAQPQHQSEPGAKPIPIPFLLKLS